MPYQMTFSICTSFCYKSQSLSSNRSSQHLFLKENGLKINLLLSTFFHCCLLWHVSVIHPVYSNLEVGIHAMENGNQHGIGNREKRFNLKSVLCKVTMVDWSNCLFSFQILILLPENSDPVFCTDFRRAAATRRRCVFVIVCLEDLEG